MQLTPHSKLNHFRILKAKGYIYEADDDDDSYYTPSGVKQFKIRSVAEMFGKASQGSMPASASASASASARPTIPSNDHFDPAAKFKMAPQVLPAQSSPFVPPPATVVAPIAKATPSANSGHGTPDSNKFSANPLPNNPNYLQLSRARQPFQMVNDAVGLNTPQRYINNYGQLNMRLYDVIAFQQVDLKTKELRRYLSLQIIIIPSHRFRYHIKQEEPDVMVIEFIQSAELVNPGTMGLGTAEVSTEEERAFIQYFNGKGLETFVCQVKLPFRVHPTHVSDRYEFTHFK